MSIRGLRYFNDIGELGYFDTPDDPYYPCGERSKTSYSLFDTNKGIKWDFRGEQEGKKEVTLTFDGGCRALINSTREYVVVVGEKKPEIAWPCNAAVFNEDGTLNHQVALPQEWIENSIDGKTVEKYKPEGIYTLRTDRGDIVFGIYFNHEWFQLRIYDIQTRAWGRVVGTGRA